MSPATDRLVALAAVTGEPDTLVSAAEVALLLELEIEHVEQHAPAGAHLGRAPWSAWLAELGFGVDERGPLTTWKQVAVAVGVSHDTVTDRRRKVGHTDPPHFDDAAAARTWWRGLTSSKPKPPKARPRRKATTATDEPLDANALLREHLGRQRR